jgi:multidrug efflux system membrane fusion protein
MLGNRHTMLPQGALPETDLYPVPVTRSEIGNVGDLRDAPSVPQGSTGRRTRRNWYVAVAAGAILVGAGVWSFGAHMTMPEQGTVSPSPPVITVALPLRENITNRTEFTGQFSAVNQVGLRAQVSGYLTEIHFQDGQIVRKGDLLFVIDPRPYEIQLQQATAQRETAAAALELADKQVARTARLNRQQIATDDLLDQRAQTQRAAAAAVQTAEAAMRSTQLNLEFTRIVAPFGGRTSMRRVSVGSLVSGGASDPTALTSIVSLDPIYLDFDMSEADYVTYRHSSAGQPADAKPTVQISLDGEQAWSRTGELNFLDNQIDRGSGTLHARATLSNPDLTIAPGQFARVRLPVSPAQPALLVPDSALATDQSSKTLMVVQDDGTVVPKQVEIGALEDNGMRVITRGLLPTDRVAINGLMRLRPGLKVEAHLALLSPTTRN